MLVNESRSGDYLMLRTPNPGKERNVLFMMGYMDGIPFAAYEIALSETLPLK